MRIQIFDDEKYDYIHIRVRVMQVRVNVEYLKIFPAQLSCDLYRVFSVETD